MRTHAGARGFGSAATARAVCGKRDRADGRGGVLGTADRRRATKLGEKSEYFCRQTLRMLSENPQPIRRIRMSAPS
ncbi:MAG: hypothetical protein IPO66_12065 [Rhodanobacteraceae bacterium]|nr:hypothetical protein [Rhodanobacteraceae bacterium]